MVIKTYKTKFILFGIDFSMSAITVACALHKHLRSEFRTLYIAQPVNALSVVLKLESQNKQQWTLLVVFYYSILNFKWFIVAFLNKKKNNIKQ